MKVLKYVNQIINRNIDEFEACIDILDLKNNENFAITLKNSGLYSHNSINTFK